MKRSKPKRGKRPAPNPSHVALRAAYSEHVQIGLRAVNGAERELIRRRPIECSLHLETAVPKNVAGRRWDYVLVAGSPLAAVGVEVHPASTSDVSIVIEKCSWARQRLARDCPKLRVHEWRWVLPTGSMVHFSAGGPESRRLALAGLQMPVRALE